MMRNFIYYHQALPLYSFKLSWLGNAAKENLFYSYVYPLYVKLFLGKHTFVAVQTEELKARFARRYHFPADRIGVFFPEVEQIETDSIPAFQFDSGTYNFVYPSMGASYKEHITIAYAMEKVYRNNKELAKRIRVHFTLLEDDNKKLFQYICEHQMEDNFVFHGNLPHQQVLSMMKSSNGLLFPSVIETFGLPLLEAAALGVPVIANDMGYAHEVLGTYQGVSFVKVHDYEEWAGRIVSCCNSDGRFASYYAPQHDSWRRLIAQIRNIGGEETDKQVVCVLATASAKRGALTIYKQFLKALASYGGKGEWHVFVDVDMPMPEIPNVSYHVCHTKGFGRIYFDLVGFARQMKKSDIRPDVIFSLQNTGVRWGGTEFVIYYHQPMPLYPCG